ncbi:MAG: Mrp/NBP35 family ATP-binding protein [Acidimicrobiales bacterium]
MPPSPPSPEHVMAMLRGVVDPELGSDIVELGMAKGARVDPDGTVTITVALTTAGCPLRAQLQRDVKTRIESLPGVREVQLRWTELTPEEKSEVMAKARWNAAQAAPETEIPPTTKVLTIASGKGGVGKSSVTVNLAAALAARGFTVGVLDADIWGFSIPRMLGIEGRLQGKPGERKILPHVQPCGTGLLKVVSMGHLVDDEETALMWRGLMLNRAVQHFIEDVSWGDMDYLLIDMPPGTGDVQMGLARMLPRAEMIVVTTPARSAQKVAVRAVSMARKSYLRVVGVIENMSSFECEHGSRYELFGAGGGAELARDAGVPLLGSIPIEPSVARGGDAGQPVALTTGPAAEAFREIASRLVEEHVPPVDMAGCSARMLDAALAALDGRTTGAEST